jgi:flagellar basal-body rod protein FlgB
MGNIYVGSKEAMSYNTRRFDVIARNIQRANMPNEKARDLQPLKGSFSRTLQMLTTSSAHLHGKNTTGGDYKAIKIKDTYETSINGNNINLVEESLRSSEAVMDFKTATDIHKAFGNMLKTASK